MCHPDDVQTLWRHGVLLGQTNDTIATIAIRMYTQILVVTSLFTFLYIVDKGELKKGKTRRYQTAVCVSVIYFSHVPIRVTVSFLLLLPSNKHFFLFVSPRVYLPTN